MRFVDEVTENLMDNVTGKNSVFTSQARKQLTEKEKSYVNVKN